MADDDFVNPWHPKQLPVEPACPKCAGETARRQEAEATVESVAVMLGWANVPPRRSLEDNLRALKGRLQEAEAQLAKAREALRAFKENVREYGCSYCGDNGEAVHGLPDCPIQAISLLASAALADTDPPA